MNLSPPFLITLLFAFIFTSGFAGTNAGLNLSKVASRKKHVENGHFVLGSVSTHGVPYMGLQVFQYGGGIDFGSMFFLTDFDSRGDMGFGARFNWIGINVSAGMDNSGSYKVGAQSLSGSVVNPGVQFSYSFSDHFGVDAYFQFFPTYAFGRRTSGFGGSTSAAYRNNSYGLEKGFGFALRMDAFYVGLDYKYGKLKSRNIDTDNITDVQSDHVRILIGAKF